MLIDKGVHASDPLRLAVQSFDQRLPGLVIGAAHNQVVLTVALWIAQAGGKIGMARFALPTAITGGLCRRLSVALLNPGARVFADGEWCDVVRIGVVVDVEVEWQGCFGFALETAGQEMEQKGDVVESLFLVEQFDHALFGSGAKRCPMESFSGRQLSRDSPHTGFRAPGGEAISMIRGDEEVE